MVIGKEKFALWITPEAKREVETHYKQDNCKSQSEYIEKAVRFYSGYLDTKHAETYLPRVLSDVLEGKLGSFGKRVGPPAVQAGGGPGYHGEPGCLSEQCRSGSVTKTPGPLCEKCERDQRRN